MFQELRIGFYFVGITGAFVVYSLIQERLMTVGFGPEEERFQYSVFIVLVNRIVTCVVALVSLGWIGQPLAPAAPLLLFAVPSLANVVSSSAQYEALKYVSFPLQALAKCAKSVPVMGWSWVTRTRRYKPRDYASALAVTAGCAFFVLAGDIAAPSTKVIEASNNQLKVSWSPFTNFGLLLLSIFMIFDGLTSTSQDKLFGSYEMHSCNQLLYTAAWSAVFSLVFLMFYGQMMPSIFFVLRHPESLWFMMGQSVVSTTVQLFIVFTIKQYGALNFALMMTLRQFLSIIFSCLVFQHYLTPLQWLGTLLVIGGLFSRSFGTATRQQGDKPHSRKATNDKMEEAQEFLTTNNPPRRLNILNLSDAEMKLASPAKKAPSGDSDADGQGKGKSMPLMRTLSGPGDAARTKRIKIIGSK